MTRQLVLVHGRAQEHKEASPLKAEWLETLAEGLTKSNLKLPIPEDDVRFPYYGDTLYEMAAGRSDEEAAKIILRGNGDVDEQEFARDFIEEVRSKVGITDDQLAEVSDDAVIHKGPLNSEWSLAVLRAVDRFIPFASGTSIALFTHDVYEYLKNAAVRETIENGVSAAITPGVETVVVAHSLGTVVAYNLIRQRGHLLGWKIPLLVTVGSPLAVSTIRKIMQTFARPRCPECVSCWFNAMDKRDLVALYPLDAQAFPLNPTIPAIENKPDVRNKTTNRHGITGYLDDQEVARRIHDALLV
jgi:hypothetical protein